MLIQRAIVSQMTDKFGDFDVVYRREDPGEETIDVDFEDLPANILDILFRYDAVPSLSIRRGLSISTRILKGMVASGFVNPGATGREKDSAKRGSGRKMKTDGPIVEVGRGEERQYGGQGRRWRTWRRIRSNRLTHSEDIGVARLAEPEVTLGQILVKACPRV